MDPIDYEPHQSGSVQDYLPLVQPTIEEELEKIFSEGASAFGSAIERGSTWKYPDIQRQHCEATIATAPIDTTVKVNPSAGSSKKRRIRNKVKKKSTEMTAEQKIKRNIKKGKWRSRQKIKKLMEGIKGDGGIKVELMDELIPIQN